MTTIPTYLCEYTNLLGFEHDQTSVNNALISLSKRAHRSYADSDVTYDYLSFNIVIDRRRIEFPYNWNSFLNSLSTITGRNVVDSTGIWLPVEAYKAGELNRALNYQTNSYTYEPEGIAISPIPNASPTHSGFSIPYVYSESDIEQTGVLHIHSQNFITNIPELITTLTNAGIVLDPVRHTPPLGYHLIYNGNHQILTNPLDTTITCIERDTVNYQHIVVSSLTQPLIDTVNARLAVLDIVKDRILDNTNENPVSNNTRLQLRSNARFLEGIAREIKNDLNIT